MKFYYNGKLVRTSKTHEYKYAVIATNRDDKVLTCSTTKNGAQAFINRYISEREDDIKTSENIIKAIESGARGFYAVRGRKTDYINIRDDHSVEYSRGRIEECKRAIEFYLTYWKVVELEARA
jgi:hypothetical protein